MKTKQPLLWLLSLLMLATPLVFTSCSSDDDDKNDPNVIIAGENDPLGTPIGLVYTDFLTANDVIHNADTTELSISKALADKKGITNFVNHPMGIWDDQQHRAYLRRATEQRLVGDRYVLKVVRSTIAEITGGEEMQLNTKLYYNPTRMVSRGGLTRASQGDPEADKYIDDKNVIHPAAITLRTKPNSGANSEDLDLSQAGMRTITIEQMFSGKTEGANSWFSDLWDDFVDAVEDAWDAIVEATSYDWDDDNTWSLLKSKTTISSDIKFNCGKEPADTITLRFRCPIEFNLDYTLNIRSHGSIETAFVPVPSYLKTYIDGYFEANPQLRIGFSKTITLPEDKQRVKLFSFSGIGYTFMIGPVPVAIDIDPSVYLKFTSTLKGNAYFGVQYDIATKFRVGVQYENGELSGIGEGEKVKDEFSFINPRLELEYIGGVGLFFGVDIIIEKIGGPTFNIGPQVNVNAKLSYEIGDDRINASIEGKAGIGGEVGAKLKIFGFELADWRTYFDIGPQWTIFKYPDDGSGSSGGYDPNNGGGGNGGIVDLGKLTGNYTAKSGETLTGTLNGNYKVSVADGASVMLSDVTIKGIDSDKYMWAGINCEGDATIILIGTNSVTGFHSYSPGINVPAGKTLTIQGNGSLTASSTGFAAGIGGGSIYTNCGNIIIDGGTITAHGGAYSAAIGGSYNTSCGNITITNNVNSVTVTKRSSAPYSIGAGPGGTCGTVTIGGTVGAISQNNYTFIPGLDLSTITSDYTAQNGERLVGTLNKNVKISIADGATVTLNTVTINGTNSESYQWAGINCPGDATIILEGRNTVKGFIDSYPGIHIAEGKTLTIRGNGSLNASSNGIGAGIGGGAGVACGNIIIKGGDITATGGYAAGIGGGGFSRCGDITITGGTVKATGGESAAGIGGGGVGICGDIIISSGVNSVTATKGQNAPYSIGAGGSGGTCGTVTIGGKVTGNISTSPYTYKP